MRRLDAGRAVLIGRVSRAGLVQLAKFVVVGLVNTAFSYGVFALFVWLGMNYAVANLSSLVVGLLFSFKTQGALVFGNAENRRIFRFVLTWAFLYAFSTYVISRFVALGFDSYQSGALAIPFTTALSFVAQKFFVFRRSRVDATEAGRGRP